MKYKGECKLCKKILSGNTEEELLNNFTKHNEKKHTTLQMKRGIALKHLFKKEK